MNLVTNLMKLNRLHSMYAALGLLACAAFGPACVAEGATGDGETELATGGDETELVDSGSSAIINGTAATSWMRRRVVSLGNCTDQQKSCPHGLALQARRRDHDGAVL
ncbi:hypothetical protein BE20_00350 [Sorangium cellulosum]|nr:hypothetical protein BE20_00350 [Sorangium cellulosum]